MTPSPVGMRCPECAGDTTRVERGGYTGATQTGTNVLYVLIGLSVLGYLAQMATSAGGGISSYVGDVFFDGAFCINAVGDGGVCGGAFLSDGGEFWRIFTSGFLHGGLFHLAINMYVLWLLWGLLEPDIGWRRTLAIYVVSLIGGALGVAIESAPEGLTLGASGAVYGLFGAAILVGRERGMSPVVNQLMFWLILNLVLTFSISTISIGGHLGGLALGGVATLLILYGSPLIRGAQRQRIELVALGLIGVAGFVATIVISAARSTGLA